MQEVIREHPGQPWTNLLIHGKPYLVLDSNTGRFYVQFWKVIYGHGGTLWLASDWADHEGHSLTPEQQANGWPKDLRVFKLPTVDYPKATQIIPCDGRK